MEDHIKFQSLPPLKRLRLLQSPNLHDDKENTPNFSSSFQLPAKKRKESRPHHLPQSPVPSSDYTAFSLPTKKRVSAFDPDFFLGNPLSPFDLNIEYKPPSSLDQGTESIGKENESQSSIVANLFEEIPQLLKEDKVIESPPSVADNLFEEIPQLVKEDKVNGSPTSSPDNLFKEIPQRVEEDKNDEYPNSVPNLFVEIPQLVKEFDYNGSVPSVVAHPFQEMPQLVEEKEVLVEEQEGEDNDDGIVCAICHSTDGDPTDPIVFCDGCDLMVHTTCYGNPLIMAVPDGDWFCAQCLVSRTEKPINKEPFSCCLCPTRAGAMKPTKDGLWAHIVCAVFVPEVFFEDPDGREGINCCKIPKRRWQDKCYICKTRKGCAIRCSEPKCPLAFHVTCGLNQDLCIEYKQGRKNEEIIVAGFCKTHTELWKKQQQTGKFKIVASKENIK